MDDRLADNLPSATHIKMESEEVVEHGYKLGIHLNDESTYINNHLVIKMKFLFLLMLIKEILFN